MIDQRQRRMPEWLPYVGELVDADTIALIVGYYADQIGELCAGIQFTLQQHHEKVQVYCYTAKDVRDNWVPEGQDFTLAHVTVANWAHAKVVRFVQLRCEKATGHIVLINYDHLLAW